MDKLLNKELCQVHSISNVIRMIKSKKNFFNICLSASQRTVLHEDVRGGLISLWLYKGNKKLRDKNIYFLYIFPPELHTLMTSLF
jgi:hypothetical protein